jgi:hypothetical protein
MKKITKYLPHYLPLIGILVTGLFGFWYFSYDRFFQAAVVIAVAVGYVTWGIIHHIIHKDIYLEVVLEYVLIAVLCSLAILSVIFRA